MALYLASDDSEFVTGQAMIVDGGLTSASQFAPLDQAAAAQATPPRGFIGPSFQS